MRTAQQPGPAASERIDIVKSRGKPLRMTLRKGRTLDDAIAEAMAEEGLDSAWLEFKQAPVEKLNYVIPDKAPDTSHVAWYSQTYSFPGHGVIDHIGLTVGRFNGKSFLHGHGSWTPENGKTCMGHILPGDTILSDNVEATGIGLLDARFERLFDAETNFDLFQPVVMREATDADHALVRIKPNEDFAPALNEACRSLGWSAARVYGLGSLIGTRFENQPDVTSFATEMLVLNAKAEATPSMDHKAQIAVVGEDGVPVLRGTLKPTDNPVLITAEIFMIKC